MRQKIAEPGREDVLGKPEALLKLAEAAQPVERIADDQQRPPVADRIQRPGDTAHRIPVAHSLGHRDPQSIPWGDRRSVARPEDHPDRSFDILVAK
ncbi:hypothetical protein [Bradyrhizobium elkanii]